MSTTADIKHEIHKANLVPITELGIVESVKWTTLATFIPLSLAFLITFIVYQVSRII